MPVKAQWVVFVDSDDPEAIPHLVISDPQPRIPTRDECVRAVWILNEEGSNVIRLSCHNESCKDKGGWIERSRKDADKTVYRCECCGKAMER